MKKNYDILELLKYIEKQLSTCTNGQVDPIWIDKVSVHIHKFTIGCSGCIYDKGKGYWCGRYCCRNIKDGYTTTADVLNDIRRN